MTYEDGVLLTASALAFVTVLSLIPLLTALSFVGARVFSQYPQRSLEIFVQILPYSDKSLVDAIAEFLDQAETIHGVGVIAFFVTTLYLFATVEETFNKIWNVSRRRPIRARLISFILLIFWGPLLIGATFSSLIMLRQSPAFRRLFQESFLLNVLPFVATVVGLPSSTGGCPTPTSACATPSPAGCSPASCWRSCARGSPPTSSCSATSASSTAATPSPCCS